MGRRMSASRAASDLRLLCGGAEFFPSLIDAIDAAEHEVWLETYIFDFTAIGVTVAQALMRAA